MICKTFLIITKNQQVLQQQRAILVNVFSSLLGIKQLKSSDYLTPAYISNLLISGITSSTDCLRQVESSNAHKAIRLENENA